MKAIVPPQSRRGVIRTLPATMPALPQAAVVAARRDQFGAVVLRQVGGVR